MQSILRFIKLVILVAFSLPISVQARGTLNSDVNPETILATICIPGFTKAVRPSSNYTNGVKKKLMRDAGLNYDTQARAYELDHIVPLALGGHPRKLENLELQPWEGENGAKRKDRIEVKLQCLVCGGQVPLAEAQHDIAGDWQSAYHRYAKVKCQRPRRL